MAKKKTPLPSSQPFLYRKWAWGVLLLILALAVLLRLHLLSVPLERDEGEYAYAGQLILQGIPPYIHVYNMKMPGIYGAYALALSLFGQTQTSVHVGLMVMTLGSIVLLFFLGKRLFSTAAGLSAGAGYAVLSVSSSLQGVHAHAEHFVVFFALGAILLLFHAVDSEKRRSLFLGLSGFFFGIAFLMKQHGAFFLVSGVFYLLYLGFYKNQFSPRRTFLNVLILSSSALVPFSATCIIFWLLGNFDKFWFWTFTYARQYASIISFSQGLSNLGPKLFDLIKSAPLLWVLAVISLPILFRFREKKSESLFLGLLLFFSIVSTTPGFYFRPHYFVLILPAVSLLIGVSVVSMKRFFSTANASLLKKSLATAVFVIALAHAVYQERSYLFEMNTYAASRQTYGADPFPESVEVARYIKDHTSKKDRIAVLGSEPQIYFYSDRLSATGFIYTYPLMEKQKFAGKMQEEMIGEIESSCPYYLVFVNIPSSWFTIAAKPTSRIFEWFEEYQNKYYERVGIVDMISPSQVRYNWDENARRYEPKSTYWIAVFKRKG